MLQDGKSLKTKHQNQKKYTFSKISVKKKEGLQKMKDQHEK